MNMLRTIQHYEIAVNDAISSENAASVNREAAQLALDTLSELVEFARRSDASVISRWDDSTAARFAVLSNSTDGSVCFAPDDSEFHPLLWWSQQNRSAKRAAIC